MHPLKDWRLLNRRRATKRNSLTSLFRRSHNTVWVTMALILGLVPGLYAQEAYPIRLGRHSPPVGQEFELRIDLHTAIACSFSYESRSQQSNTTSSIECLAHAKVLAKAKGSNTTELVIQRLIERQATNCSALLAPGTVVTMKTVVGERFFTTDHGQLSLAVTKVLTQLLGSASNDTGCTDDQALGTPEPKKIGDTWKGSSDCVIRGLNKYLGTVEPNQFDVTMKLLGVEEAAGTKCLRLSLSLSIHTEKPLAVIAKDPRSRLFNAKWDTKFHYEAVSLLPMDADLPCLRMEQKFDGVSKVKYTKGKKVALIEFPFAEQKTIETTFLN